MPWSAKKKSTETKLELPEVSGANLCSTISLTHSCIQKLETKLGIVPATPFAEEPKTDEVRWSVHVLRSL